MFALISNCTRFVCCFTCIFQNICNYTFPSRVVLFHLIAPMCLSGDLLILEISLPNIVPLVYLSGNIVTPIAFLLLGRKKNANGAKIQVDLIVTKNLWVQLQTTQTSGCIFKLFPILLVFLRKTHYL